MYAKYQYFLYFILSRFKSIKHNKNTPTLRCWIYKLQARKLHGAESDAVDLLSDWNLFLYFQENWSLYNLFAINWDCTKVSEWKEIWLICSTSLTNSFEVVYLLKKRKKKLTKIHKAPQNPQKTPMQRNYF